MGGGGDSTGVRIGLSAVVMALHDRQAVVLTIGETEAEAALPFGPFDPAADRTFELALRAFVTAQTGFRLGFVEQLYTFGDLGRASPRATPGPERMREVSVGYLALTRAATETPAARWTPIFDIFPWEDRRSPDAALMDRIAADLTAWAGAEPRRQARVQTLFALRPGLRWNEERVLDRYELLYEAGLVTEAARDRDEPPPAALGRAMASDHRRILATGLGRLRSKLKYRPVLFDLAPETFTLFELQAAAEAVSGLLLHKQNFRRGVERSGLAAPTGVMSATGGRPAELFRFAIPDPQGAPAGGLPLPTLR
ncbi:MAG TPA: NAD regulator [Brevundimonas sp.]|uniref:NUDIX hydrolase n=1 Tax=Brevundimonas sp. TaxID=1871086 RepID=UPI00262D5267|nr:NAD regulator [Brevundimonas sp.]HRO33275.1 NAD regulator [Brevundimonas sp.]